MTEKQKYFALQALVCEELPPYAVDMAIRAGYGKQYESASRRLAHVKQGKVANLADLLALVQHSMPRFNVPEYLLPATATEPDLFPTA
ncbi:hypothetical protein F1C16_03010 [Hymenobacter sp. NBH84]|uniref:hypothetical protein n=1 Tax=Hymenobacter sp. NBH84 TaxID=2596915 RepID=UPI0016259E19|nr:hypothetical protein [Hymenobacter sp. NBH84]QNE38593.1 hypothetical protein F1C16_03010 [Hymenobacter sp. NBH84]